MNTETETTPSAATLQPQQRKTALVTGSSAGIGRAIAEMLAQEGFDVVIHYRTSGARAEETAQFLAQRYGVRTTTLAADLTDPQQATALVEAADQAFDGLGVLVNNVGNFVFKPLIETSFEEWRDMLDSNLSAAFYTCKAAIPKMRAAGYGRIINLGYAGAQNLISRPQVVPYTIAKTGILVLTRTLAATEIEHGISVNIIAPGVIENSVIKPVHEIPAGRVGTLDEIAQAARFLVTSSAYITGQVVEVAGGWGL